MTAPVTPQTLGLAMIVRDEADNIVRCLESAKPHITSWTIVDTGSEDDTPALVERTLEGIDGKLYHSQWRGFGPNRSELMALAKGTADYLLMLDADMVLHMPDPLPPLTLDCYHGRILNASFDYTLPFLVRGDRDWLYVGVAHSYLACAGPYTEANLPGLGVDDYSVVTDEKIRGDLELLSAEHGRNPLDARTAFYLAQTYYDLDMIPEAIAMYRYRASIPGWVEETFYAKYMLGMLLCEHVSFNEGARELLDAWEFRPSRIEPLRILANVANSIADKAPYPTDRLFVHKNKYKPPDPVEIALPPAIQISYGAAPTEAPSLEPTRRRKPRVTKARGLNPLDVTAIIVTRGDRDITEIVGTRNEPRLPYGETIVWDNSKREFDYKVFGRYAAISEAANPVIYWQDDDVIFTEHAALLKEYEPGKIISNMDQPWIDGAGYQDGPAMVGAGSLCDSHLPALVFGVYLGHHPFDDDLLLECDFMFGTLAPWKRVDLGYEVRDFADGPDRLYRAVGQTERKWRMIERARSMLDRELTRA